jgi:hypothetical protein
VETFVCHGSDQSATAIALMARHEYHLQVPAFLANDRLGKTPLCLVKVRPTHAQCAATLLNRDGLLVQFAHDLVDHFISWAKKAEAFLRCSRPCEVADFLTLAAGSSASRHSVAYQCWAGHSVRLRIGPASAG